MAGFSISIVAQDKASAGIDAVNRRLAAMRAPADKLQKSLSTFGKLSGVTQTAAGVERVARAGWDSARAFTSALEPLGIITGAASVAGLVRLTQAWSQFGVSTGNTAQRLDVTTDSLQALEGAAKLAGATAGDMDSGLRGLQQTLYDATNGKNAQAVAYFQRLGIAYQDSTGHALKADDVFKQLATTIAGFKNPAAQAAVANLLMGGAAEPLLPLIRRGGAGINTLAGEARGYGQLSPDDIRNAREYAAAMARLDLASSSLGRTISSVLGPVLTPVVQQLSDFIKNNQVEIRSNLEDFAKRASADLKELGGGIKYVVDELGGWKNATEDVLSLYLGARFFRALANARLLALVASGGKAGAVAGGLGYVGSAFVTTGAVVAGGLVNNALTESAADKRQETGHRNRAARSGIYTGPVTSQPDTGATRFFDRILQGLGIEGSDTPAVPQLKGADAKAKALSFFQTREGGAYTAAQSAGIFSNLQSESGLNPFAKGDGGQAFGVGQWHEDRQAQFAKVFGHTMQSTTDASAALAEQLAFVTYELSHGERRADMKLRASAGYYEAGSNVSRYYERPGAVEEAARNRGNLSLSLDPSQTHQVRGEVGVKVTVQAEPGTTVTKQTARATGNAKVALAMTGDAA